MDKENNQPLISLKGVQRSIKNPLPNIGQNPSQYQACATDKSKTNGEKNSHLENYPKEIITAYRELPIFEFREKVDIKQQPTLSNGPKQVSKNKQDKGNSGEKRLTLIEITQRGRPKGCPVVKDSLMRLNRANICFELVEDQKKKSRSNFR